jgi:hypothetical protein
MTDRNTTRPSKSARLTMKRPSSNKAALKAAL